MNGQQRGPRREERLRDVEHVHGQHPGDDGGQDRLEDLERVGPQDGSRRRGGGSRACGSSAPTARCGSSSPRGTCSPTRPAAPPTLIGVCHDVTERVRGRAGARPQRAAHARDHRQHALDGRGQGPPGPLPDGQRRVGPACSGCTPSGSSGMPLRRPVPGRRSPSGCSPPIAARRRRAQPVYDEAVLLVRRRRRAPTSTVTFPLPDDDGRPIETCTIGTDVTERRERESERRERIEWARPDRPPRSASSGMLVFAQPIFELATGAAVLDRAARAHARRLTARELQPAAFLPAAERLGLVQAIDVWMVRARARTPRPAPAR